MDEQTVITKMENSDKTEIVNIVNKSIKIEDPTKEVNSGRVTLSPNVNDNASSLMIDSEDESLNENEDENFEAWRATERRLSSTIDGELYDCEDDLGISMENKNTQRKTDTDIRIFITYLRSINEFRAPELIQPFHLDRYLSAFFSVVKKHDGNEYEPASLRGMLCSVERYLRLKNYPQSVTRDSVFVSTRNALKYKQQKLRELGKGSKKQPEPFGKLTLDKVNHLFSAHEMGPYTPMSIINTLCFLFIVHFRLRKAIDHKNLLWGDIKLHTDQNGQKYLIYEPVDIQNSIAHSKYDHHGNRLCIWETPEVSERDPVAIYKLYADKRPQNMKYENSPFYLGITSMQPSQLQSWYRTCAMGVNKLSDLVRMIRDITGLPRATMNAPTEFILSESYGIVSTSKQEKGLSTTLVPDTKHTKVFAQTTTHTPDKLSALHFDSSDHEMRADDKPICNTNSSYKTSEDSNQSDGDDTIENKSLVHDGNLTSNDSDDFNATPNAAETITLDDAKEKVQTIIRRLDQRDITGFRNWVTSVISENVYSEDLKSEVKESVGLDQKINSNHVASFPSITLNIKISPDALSGNNPISVVADLVHPEKLEEPSSILPTEKRKRDTAEIMHGEKRLKDIECVSPINLSSENTKGSVDKINDKFQNVRRISSNPGNTAVVHPRSDKTDPNLGTISNEAQQANVNRTNKLPSRSATSSSDNLGYIVPMSYPYIGPSCFAQDPRMLMNTNVVPHMAHSAVNTSYSFLQSSFRNVTKSTNQDMNNANNRFG